MEKSNLEEHILYLCIAGAIGAFIVTLGDLCNNGQSATVLKIAQNIRQYIYPGFRHGPITAGILLIVLGGLLCWVHRPGTRADAFSRGLALFAVLAAPAPYHGVTGGLTSSPKHQPNSMQLLFPIKSAYAQQQGTTNHRPQVETTIGTAEIIITPPTKSANVTLRDTKSAKIVANEQINGNSFTIKKPVGTYQVEVEASGYRITATKLQISNDKKVYRLPMESSGVPLSLQRLVSPKSTKLIEQDGQQNK